MAVDEEHSKGVDSTFLLDLDTNHECFVAPENFQPEGHLSGRRCDKNPGHVGFIAMKDLLPKHLPSDCKRQQMFELIKYLSASTVRIRSTFVSPNRPDGYPLHQLRGTKADCFGTGRVWGYGRQISPCPCADCGTKPGTVAYEHRVDTARHVIFDDTEASQAIVHAFYDQEGPPSAAAALAGVGRGGGLAYPLERDFYMFSCVTHDLQVSRSLNESLARYWELVDELEREKDVVFYPPYLAVVSHPHGFHKQVSFGNWKEKFHKLVGRNDETLQGRYHYNTPTCAGSSGATVHLWSNKPFNRPLYPCHLHQGCEVGGWNYSSEDILF